MKHQWREYVLVPVRKPKTKKRKGEAMKRIEHVCSCGASVTFEDVSCSYLCSGGHADERGRVYRVEKWSDDWLHLHAGCRLTAKGKQ